MVKNYYFILGVTNNASVSDITDAYEAKKRLAEHDATEAVMLAEAAEAYECLIDPVRRRKYDETMIILPTRATDNVHQGVSRESRVIVELEFKKLRNKRNSQKKVAKKLIMAVIFLVFAGVGIRYGMERFAKEKLIVELPSVFKEINSPGTTTEREEEAPAAVVARPGTGNPSVRAYEIKTGGLVVSDRAPCRAQPSENARVIATMRKDAVVFATEEIRGSDGTVWYYVSNSRLKGWVNGRDVRIYN
ncbi:MAG: J domain-containing protein [Synergistaceae bacterium]|jgi:hypothetical protein|nr:J domain-containing protein [Synergistaceae bacterium]